MMGITGCILAKNEGANLPDCIDNLRLFTDEIVVVDNGSADATARVAREKGCVVVREEELKRDLARNRYMEAAGQEWILVLDVDERLDAKYGADIRDALDSASDDVMGFSLPRFEYFGQGRWAFIHLLRLFRSHPQIRYNDYLVHNSPGPSIRRLGGRVEKLYAPLHHLDILIKGRTTAKRSGYIKAIVGEIEKRRGRDDSYVAALYNYLGIEHTAKEDFQEAKKCYLSSLEICKKLNETGGYRDLALLYLAQNCLFTHDYKESREYIQRLLDVNSSLSDRAYTVLAELALKDGKMEEARRMCGESLKINPLQAHQYINLASLAKGSKEKMEYMKTAIRLNDYLLNPLIYEEGEKPNIFCHQSVFLSCVSSVERLVQLAEPGFDP